MSVPSSRPACGLSLKTLSTSAPAVTRQDSDGESRWHDREHSTVDADRGVRIKENMLGFGKIHFGDIVNFFRLEEKTNLDFWKGRKRSVFVYFFEKGRHKV